MISRDQFSTLTFVNDVGVLEKAVAIFNSKIAQAKKSAVGNFTIVYLIQPIPTIFSKHSVERGGNVLGLDRDRDNLICKSPLNLKEGPPAQKVRRSVSVQSSMDRRTK